MSLDRASSLRYFMGCALPLLAACQGSSGTPESTASALSAAQSNVNDVVGSSTSASQSASACFDAFQACQQAGTDAATCQTTLDACLPAQAPMPAKCENDGGTSDDQDMDSDESDDEGLADAGDQDAQNDESNESDAGAEHRHRGKHKHHGHKCGRPAHVDALLKACREEAHAKLASGATEKEARITHASCLESAFMNRLNTLCARVDDLCKKPDANATACSDAEQTCSNSKATLATTPSTTPSTTP